MLSALQRSVCCSQRAHEEAGHEPCPGPGTAPARQGGFFTSSAHPPNSTQRAAAPPQEPRTSQFPPWDALCTPVLPTQGSACSTAHPSHALS